jgi:hypothetical protein
MDDILVELWYFVVLDGGGEAPRVSRKYHQ